MIISVFITNSNTKPLLARQYTSSLTRPQVESLLTTFSSLHAPNSTQSLSTSSSNVKGSSHQSYFEVNEHRFVFLRCEDVYIGLISDKFSNIIEDLDTLQLLNSVLKDTLEKVTAENVIDYSFEIMFAFDEVISLGYKESLSLDQVRTILEMDSHDENLHNLIQQSRIDDAAKEGKRAAKELDAKRREYQRRGLNPEAALTGMSSKDFGVSSMSFSSGFDSDSSFGSATEDSFSKRMGSIRSEESTTKQQPSKIATKAKAPIRPSVLSIKKKGAANTLVQQLAETGELERESEEDEDTVQETAHIPMNQKPVHVSVTETIIADVNREGGLNKLEISGEMLLTITDPEKTNVELHISEDRNTNFTCKAHPNIDKARFSKEGVVALKKGKTNFPTNLALKILTWRYKNDDESLLPISVSCWPSESSKGMSVNVEYELLNDSMTLENVVIEIPIPSGSTPDVTSAESGSYKYNRSSNHLQWTLDSVGSENADGSIEFDVKGSSSSDSFFPLQVSFTSTRTLSGIKVETIQSLDESNEELDFSQEIELSVSDFTIA